MIVTTARKIALARVLSRLVLLARGLFGRGPELVARRGGVRWRLDLREGVDLSIYLLGGFEPATLRLYPALVPAGGVVFDIGANVGSHTLPLARFAGPQGRVHAFEPTGYALGKLRENLLLNPDLAKRVEAHQTMLVQELSGEPAPYVYSSWPLEKAAGLHEKHLGRLMSTAGARATTLDRYVAEARIQRVDLIKIDVDGGEPGVIGGGLETLSRFRPTLVMEFEPCLYLGREDAFRGMIGALSGRGYSFSEANTGLALAADFEAIRRRIPDGASCNVVARAR